MLTLIPGSLAAAMLLSVPLPPPPPPGLETPPYVVAVDVSAEGRRLWQGDLRIDRQTAGSFQRSLTEAPPAGCRPDGGRRIGRTDQLSINISDAGGSGGKPRQFLNVDWQRPSADCASGDIQRSVHVTGGVALVPGEPVTVRGDGGLVIRLERR